MQRLASWFYTKRTGVDSKRTSPTSSPWASTRRSASATLTRRLMHTFMVR